MQRNTIQILTSFRRSIEFLFENYTIKRYFSQSRTFAFILLVSTVFLPGASKSQTPQDVKYIPGITAADVSVALEKKGFTKMVGSDKNWIYNLQNDDYTINVFISGDSPEKIIQVKATFIFFTQKPVQKIAKDFLTPVITLPYKGSNPTYARLWFDKNINGESNEMIGGVKFMISATEGSKLIIIGAE